MYEYPFSIRSMYGLYVMNRVEYYLIILIYGYMLLRTIICIDRLKDRNWQ